MQVKVFQQGPLQTNCSVVSFGNECIVVDCAYISKDIEHYVTHNELKLVAVLLTHGHFDHCGGVNHLLENCGCSNIDVYCSSKDISLCANASRNIWSVPAQNCDVTKSLEEGSLIIGNFQFEIISTPGHTPGSCVIIFNNWLFVGDTVFYRSIGRTDFPESNQEDMSNSLKKIHCLTEDYVVIPGHGQCSTLLKEKEFNPYLKRFKNY